MTPLKTTKSQTKNRYCLSLKNVEVELSSIGAAITSIKLYSSRNKDEYVDLVLGCNDTSIKENPCYFGVIVGRVANRISNANFDLNNQRYELYNNNNGNCLHGGKIGFSHVLWDTTGVMNKNENRIEFSYTSPNKEEGFPGSIQVKAKYILLEDNEHSFQIKLTMEAKLINFQEEQLASPINLAGHTYFNLSGHSYEEGILNHKLQLPNCYSYLALDDNSIPTREIKRVSDVSCMDFTKSKLMKDAFLEYANESNFNTYQDLNEKIKNRKEICQNPFGLDHNYIISPNVERTLDKGNEATLPIAGIVTDTKSNRQLIVRTNAPGVQVYTGNYLNPSEENKNNVRYLPWQGICLETQHFPDSISTNGDYDQEYLNGACIVLNNENDVYHHTIEYHFSY